MNVEQFESNTGWRGVFHGIPATRNAAHKAIMPLGYFFSPFLPEANAIKTNPALCAKCRASLSSFCQKNKNTKTWVCSFCLTSNPLVVDIGLQQVEEYVESKVGENGLYFIVDLCLPQAELAAIKEVLLTTIEKLPPNIFVGLLAFNRNIFIFDFEQEYAKFSCLNGQQDYALNGFGKLREVLNIQGVIDPKLMSKVIANRYYVPLSSNRQKLVKAISSLQHDKHHIPRDQREKRATGCAVQVAIGLLADLGISTRFSLLLGGPCTVGSGKVVDLPLKKTIRSYVDIIEGNQNTQFIKSATAFYDGLEEILVKQRHTFDIWAYGLDQFGLMEMKGLVNGTGGMLAMHQLFNHFIFRTSFERFYEANEYGMFSFPIATHISLRISKELRVNGILGTAKSLKDNVLKQAAEMEIGEGGTSSWYLGGISPNSALCFILSHAQANASQNKQRTGDIQAVVTYKWSDNIIRTRVSTLRLQYLRDNQIAQLGKRFDEQAAAVMLARMVSRKTEVQDTLQVKKWVDRLLLKFSVRFAFFNRNDRASFRLPHPLKHFPQFIYHLRRSAFINPFGSPPDQSIYVKTCMNRQSIPNCMVMIQPALLSYSPEQQEPVPVQLDLNQLKENVVLLLDSYFNVLVWYGENVYAWKEQNLQEDPEYEYLKDFFAMPMQDASEIMYDRLPVSNFYETFKNDGKERYLKSRVNPSKSNKVEDDGHFVSDDAPITLFMDFLIRSVINYNE